MGLGNFPARAEMDSQQSAKEREFYEGYHKRLKAKLKQKNLQISRDSHLLESLPEAEKHSFELPVQQTINERDELQKQTDQMRRPLEDDGLKK